MMKTSVGGQTSGTNTGGKYDGLDASAYLEREFNATGKPHDCTCGYPKTKMRNGIGHPSDCPTWHRLAPAYYERRGQKFVGINDEGYIMLSALPDATQKAPLPPEEHATQAASRTTRGPNPNAPTESVQKGSVQVGQRAAVIDDDGNVWVESGEVTFLGDDGRIEVIGDGNCSGMWPARFVRPLQEGTEYSQMSTEVYDSVVQAINEGTVTTAHFNQLLSCSLNEGTDKSARERLHRRTRVVTQEPPEHSMLGRVVPKKTGRNDPPRQGRGRRYASGTPAKERQNEQQRKKRSARLHEALANILNNLNADTTTLTQTLAHDGMESLKDVRAAASALLQSPTALDTIRGTIGEAVDDTWLFGLLQAADARLLAAGERPELVPAVSLIVTRESKGEATGTQGKGTGQTGRQGGRPAAPSATPPTTPAKVLAERKNDSPKPPAKAEKKEEGDGEKKSKRERDREERNREETRSYEVTGKVRQLDNLEKLLKWVEYCGNVGHSASASIFVDGDGAAHLKFKGLSAEMPETDHNARTELKVGLD